MDKITRFKGKYEFLSNYYPCMVELDGELYPSVEHAYQAAKTMDPEARKHFKVMDGADTAHHFGRHLDVVKKGAVIRPDWEDVRTDIMYRLVRDKFTRTEPFESQAELRQQLLDTGDAYLENENTYRDRFWGTVRGEGRNELGKILMKVRDGKKTADELFKVCARAIDNKIVQDQRPAAEERLQQEMDIIQENGLTALFLDLKKFIAKYGIRTWEISGRDCWTGNSLTMFLLGLSEVNPLVLHIPSDFLDMDVNEAAKTQHSVVEFNIPFHYMKELDKDNDIHRWGFMPSAYSSEYDPDAPIRIRFTRGMKQSICFSDTLELISQLAGMTGIEPDKIKPDEKGVLMEMKKIIQRSAEDYLQKGEDGHPVGDYCDPEILEKYHPADVYQFGKLISLVYNKPLWEANAPVIDSGGGLEDLIICREDIYDCCKRFGIEGRKSYLIAHDTSRGLWEWGDIEKRMEYERIMRLSEMPEYYIRAIEGAYNLFSRSRDTKMAVNQYRLAWYKVYFEDVYKVACEKVKKHDGKQKRSGYIYHMGRP